MNARSIKRNRYLGLLAAAALALAIGLLPIFRGAVDPTGQVNIAMVGAGKMLRWHNQPAGSVELGHRGEWETRYDASDADSVRINVAVIEPGAPTANLYAEYSTDGTRWKPLGAVTGPSVAIGSAGLKTSEWTSIDAPARGDVILRIVGTGGNGAADPAFGRIDLQLKQH